MNTELLEKQVARYESGIPDKKAFKLLRNERNILGCYKIIGNYHKIQQKNELGDDAHVSTQRV